MKQILYICHLYIYFDEVFLKVFGHFLIGLFVFLLAFKNFEFLKIDFIV